MEGVESNFRVFYLLSLCKSILNAFGKLVVSDQTGQNWKQNSFKPINEFEILISHEAVALESHELVRVIHHCSQDSESQAHVSVQVLQTSLYEYLCL